MRILGMVSLVLAAVAVAFAVMPLTRIGAEDADSPDSFYIEAAALMLAFAVALALFGWAAWRRR